MSEIDTCVLCGRRGTQRFVMVAPDEPGGQYRARCQDRRACRRRSDAARTDWQAPDADPAEPGPASSGAVAGLARQVEELAREVRELRGLRGQVDDTTRVLGELAGKVQELAARPKTEAAPSWLGLPPDAVEPMFADLIEWLRAVWLRYPDGARALPECWAFHPDVVEELLWLRQAHHAAYDGPAAAVTAAADWHDRYRPGVVARIKKEAGGCSLENHTAPAPPAAAPLAGLLEPVVTWWAETRDEAAPAPSEAQFAQAADAYLPRR